MYGTARTAKRLLRFGTACLLAALACAASVAMAVEMTPRMLVPVGHTVGIKLFSKGVVVVKLTDGGTPARACGLRTGDVIVQCGGDAVTSSEQFQSLLQTCGGTAELEVRRNGDSMTLSVEPERNDRGVYCIGAWIRDSMAGIGTMTYYDPESGSFGALGHGITDVDTAQLMSLGSGSIMETAVKAVKKGERGDPGELKGDFSVQRDVGTVTVNSDGGIFGTVSDADFLAPGEAVPVASAEEVKPGRAVIRSTICGDEIREYEVQIVKVYRDKDTTRNLLLRITDPELLQTTGGIVQGMSGSPILQNGKLVGAVTHVMINDPAQGYGIFAENMLAQAG